MWDWIDKLVTGDEATRKEAWLQIASPGALEKACRKAVEADDAESLQQAWNGLVDPASQVLPYLEYFFQSEGDYRGLRVDVWRVFRSLPGTVASALAALAARTYDLDGLVNWIHRSAAVWGSARPRERLGGPLSAALVPAGERFRTGPSVPWPAGLEPVNLLTGHYQALVTSRPDEGRAGAACDQACRLAGKDRKILRSAKLPVLGARASGGLVAWLRVEQLEPGTGDCFADPRLMSFLPLTQSFVEAADEAWRAAQLVHRVGLRMHADLRWSVQGSDLTVLDGGSMGLALAIAFSQMLRGDPLDAECAVTGAVQCDGAEVSVIHVESVADKVIEALQHPSIRRVLVPANDREEAESAARKAVRASGPVDPAQAIASARTLQEACEQSSGLVTGLRDYLKALQELPNQNPAPYLGKRKLTELFVPPDVLKQVPRRDPDARDAEARDKEDRKPTSRKHASPETLDLGKGLYADASQADEQRVAWEKEWQGLPSLPTACVVLLAPPGQGKTTLARMTAARLAERTVDELTNQTSLDRLTLPIVVRLPELCGRWSGGAPDDSMREALRKTITANGHAAAVAEYLARHAGDQRTWLILDALDEVGPQEPALGVLFGAMKSWRCRAIITSRPYGFEGRQFPVPVTRYRLAPLSSAQVDIFVRRWFGDGPRALRILNLVRQDRAVQQVSENPFLLTLLCWVGERHDLSTQITRTGLYDQIFTDVLGLPPGGEGPVDPKRAKEWLPVLGAIALTVFQEDAGRKPLAYERLLDWLEASPQRPSLLDDAGRPLSTDRLTRLSPRQQAIALLTELVKKRLLVPFATQPDYYVFPNRSVLEYLTGCALATRAEPRNPRSKRSKLAREATIRFLDKKCWDPDWEEVIRFLAGRLSQPVWLLKLLGDAAQDDLYRHRLALGSLCMAEVTPRDHPEIAEMVNGLTAAHFGIWWEHQVKGSGGAIHHLHSALFALGSWNGQVRSPRRPEQVISLLDCLADLLRDPDRGVHRTAAEAVKALGGAAATETFLARLADLLRDPDSGVRPTAAEAVGALGGAAATETILARLADLLRGPDRGVRHRDVRQLAAKAIGDLQPKGIRIFMKSRGFDRLRIEKRIYSRRVDELARGDKVQLRLFPEP